MAEAFDKYLSHSGKRSYLENKVLKLKLPRDYLLLTPIRPIGTEPVYIKKTSGALHRLNYKFGYVKTNESFVRSFFFSGSKGIKFQRPVKKRLANGRRS